ncbi:hypothetical protein AAFF_G00238660 [Aldrovandia affinis]|uniref:Uncharacterized protein n=1 Tax=Aldrovandia affinis TaxID=143900 RepID=A0AAD7W3X5_9TELE|nr:hypothetical protein AAFF_G00238660 [Aldrovandia affinis]
MLAPLVCPGTWPAGQTPGRMPSLPPAVPRSLDPFGSEIPALRTPVTLPQTHGAQARHVCNATAEPRPFNPTFHKRRSEDNAALNPWGGRWEARLEPENSE